MYDLSIGCIMKEMGRKIGKTIGKKEKCDVDQNGFD